MRLRSREFSVIWVALAAALRVGAAHAGAWAQGEGQGLVIVATTFDTSGQAFDAKGRLSPVSYYRKFELGLYAEYGLTDNVTLVARPSFENVTTGGPPPGAYRGIEAMEAGARVQLAKIGDAVFAAQALVKIPGSTNRSNTALAGSTADEIEARFLAGASISAFDRPGFIEADVAWRGRDGGHPGEARLDVTLGLRVTDKAQLLLQSFNATTTGAGDAVYPAQRSAKLQPSVVYEIAPGWSLQGGAYATVAAQNARRERGVVVAVWKKF